MGNLRFPSTKFVRQLNARFNETWTLVNYARCLALQLPIEINEEIGSMEPVIEKLA